MSRFLVTGGAGFIGSHIVNTLVKKGHSVRVLDNFSSGKTSNLKEIVVRIELIKGDIRSSNACFKATKNVDFVLHQAALRSVPKSMLNPAEYNCKIFSYHYGLSTVSLRYFNVFGPRQSLDDEYAVVIPQFITCMLNKE